MSPCASLSGDVTFLFCQNTKLSQTLVRPYIAVCLTMCMLNYVYAHVYACMCERVSECTIHACDASCVVHVCECVCVCVAYVCVYVHVCV